MPKGWVLSDLLQAKTKSMTPDQLVNFRAALAELLPAVIDQAAAVARSDHGANQNNPQG